MTVVLASGSTEAASSDIVVAAGGAATVFLTDAAGPMVDQYATAEIQIKATNNEYYSLPGGVLNRDNMSMSIASPGTYRVLRRAANAPFAIEQT